MEEIGVLYVVGAAFLIVLGVLWFFLPFAIFGIKDKLSELIEESKTTNKQLSELQSEIVTLKSGGQETNY